MLDLVANELFLPCLVVMAPSSKDVFFLFRNSISKFQGHFWLPSVKYLKQSHNKKRIHTSSNGLFCNIQSQLYSFSIYKSNV